MPTDAGLSLECSTTSICATRTYPGHPMGDSDSTAIAPSFNGSIKVEGRSEKLTCHAGLVLLREMDERLELTTSLASKLVDERSPERIQHSLTQRIGLPSWQSARSPQYTKARFRANTLPHATRHG